MYTYFTEKERSDVLDAREKLQQLKLGAGGEAYIARDEWCYNCGECGHLGDVSSLVRFHEHPETSMSCVRLR